MADYKKIVLASQSPRRKDLLSYFSVPFEIKASSIAEEFDPDDQPEKIATDLALQKAEHIFLRETDQGAFVIGADTIVVLDKEILGKPRDIKQASEMLMMLSGRKHQVITGVAFCWHEKNVKKSHTFFESTTVEFEKISPELLSRYLKTNESLDKAGAYGIQGPSLTFVKKVEGSYSNVVGFPINRVFLEAQTVLKNDFFEIFK